MSEPIKHQFTEQELVNLAREFMAKTHEDLKRRDPDVFYTKFGLLYDFITEATRNRGEYEKP